MYRVQYTLMKSNITLESANEACKLANSGLGYIELLNENIISREIIVDPNSISYVTFWESKEKNDDFTNRVYLTELNEFNVRLQNMGFLIEITKTYN